MTVADLEPAACRMAELVRGVPEDALDGPTPCRAHRASRRDSGGGWFDFGAIGY